MFSPIIRSQEENIISATKAMIETHVAETAIIITPGIYLKYYNQIPLHNGNNVKTNCDIDELPEGRFPINHIRPFYLTV